jgi:hypothetical protein
MYTWKELADKFEDLQKPLSHAFISVQWGNAGTHVYLKGITDGVAMSKFKNLAKTAGKKLDAIPKDTQVTYPDVFQELSHYHRWLTMLWKHGPGIDGHKVAQEVKDDKVLGNIHTGIIKNPAQESANICMGLAEYDKEETGWFEWAWNHGGQELVIGILLIILGIVLDGIFGISDLFKNSG